MKGLRRLVHRLNSLRFRRQHEKELAEELESHIQMQTDDNIRAGMTPDEARRAAVLQFGSIDTVKERHREERRLPFLEGLVSDLKYAIRSFARTPGFTITAIGALALGIGATTAIFSVVNAALLKPMRTYDADRLVMFSTHIPDADQEYGVISPAKFAHFRKQTSIFTDVSGFVFDGVMNYTGNGTAEQFQAVQFSAQGFHCFGIAPVLGRTFTPEEDSPNGPRVVVLGQGLWARRFGSDREIVGKTVTLNDESYLVVGVVEDSEALKHDFGASNFPEVYVPLKIAPDARDEGNYFNGLARLKPGVSLEQARERLKVSTAEFRANFHESFPSTDSTSYFTVTPLREIMVKDYRPLFAILLSAVVFVLLMACANVASLLLARAAGRTREIAIRSAIGAGRRRVIRQLMTESLVLSLAAGVFGSLAGFRAIRALLTVDSFDIPFLGDNGDGVFMDWHVMAFALLASLLTAVIFGLLPALQASRADINTLLKNSGPRSGGGIRQNKARAMLVTGEVVLAVILLVGSALLIRSFVGLYRADRGFDPQNVLAVDTVLSGPKYKTANGTALAVKAGLEQIQSTPGVVTAGASGCMLIGCSLTYSFDVDGWPSGTADQDAGWSTITPGFFESLHIPMKRGRVFRFDDDDRSPNVVIINEAMARKFWKDRDPLQDRLEIHNGTKVPNEPERQIIGIVADVREYAREPRPMMYVPAAQFPSDEKLWHNTGLTWVIRTQTSPQGLTKSITESLHRATGLPAGKAQPLRELVSASIAEDQLSMLLMTLFGISAVLLAGVGIYGVMSSMVQQRTQEIGIRMALGAQATEVRNMVVREGAVVLGAGIIVGLAASWVLARAMQSLLYGVKAHDPVVFIAVPLFLGAVALFSAWIPATRASRVNPVESLRCE